MKLEVNTASKEKPAYKNQIPFRLKIGNVHPYYVSYLRLDMVGNQESNLN